MPTSADKSYKTFPAALANKLGCFTKANIRILVELIRVKRHAPYAKSKLTALPVKFRLW